MPSPRAALSIPLFLAFVISPAACKKKNGGTADDTPPQGSGSAAPTPTAPTGGIPDCKPPPPRECHSAACGGNSPITNSFPVNGIRPNGDCNVDGVQLLAELSGGGCNGRTLGLRDGKLVGLKKKHDPCGGKALVGATFQVQNWEKTKATIKIADVRDEVLEGETREIYVLESASGTKLCGPDASKDFRKGLKLDPVAFTDEVKDPAHDFVIALSSELYDAMGNAVEPSDDWQSQDREWINLACVDDALAKRTLYDLDTPNNTDRNRKALRMLTADYCGGEPMTMRGIEIAWAKDKLWEARWTPTGAKCVSAPRLLHTTGETPTVPADLPPRLQFDCGTSCTPAQWDKHARTCPDPDDPSKTIELPKCDVKDECPAKGCKPRELDSYINLKPS